VSKSIETFKKMEIDFQDTNSRRSSNSSVYWHQRERKRNSIDGRPCPFCDAGPILSVETRVLPTNDVDKDEATATGVSGPPHFVDGQNGAYTYREKGRKLVDLFCLNFSNPILFDFSK
jgi:hypothetical protein